MTWKATLEPGLHAADPALGRPSREEARPSSRSESHETDSLLVELARTPDRPSAPRFVGTDRYEVRSRLGEGGFGVVYEVHDRALDRRVALKLLKEGAAPRVEHLKREFRSMADLAHQNLVGLHELVGEGDHWFITMELVEGVDFLTHVRGPSRADRARPATPERIDRLREAARQLAEGVHFIHEAGKLHRDLKPSNVLVDAGGRVVIMDFGLVYDLQEDARSGSGSAGTPAYMAPEQLSGSAASHASDWYGFGVMLYQALCGRLPFGGSSDDMRRAKARLDPSPPSSHDPSVPEDLQDLCLALLRRDPSARPAGRDVLARLGAGPLPPSCQPVDVALVGRAAILRELEACCDEVAAGGARAVFLHGDPGVGKSALCRHFQVHARERRGALVLAARCYERESVPFKALDGVVDALAAHLRGLERGEAAAMPADVQLLARLFPVLGGVPALEPAAARSNEVPDRQELRRRAFAALKQVLRRLGDERLVVVLVDDLQWGDLDSAHLLAELLGPPDPPRLLFVGTYRTDARRRSEALRTLLVDPSGSGREHREIHVDALGEDDAIELAERLARSRAAPLDRVRLERVAREAGGHPLFLRELILDASALDAHASLHEIIARRVAQLEREARSLLEVVALAGRPLPRQVCFEATGIGAVGPDVMRLLGARHLVRTSGPGPGDWVEPFHDRVRDAVVAATPPGSARAHHMSLATTLERFDADAETLAEHFDAAGDAARAGHYATVAADAASEALAFDRAAKLYQLALERRDPRGEERARLLERLGEALAHAGRGDEAGRAFLRAARATGGDTRELRRRAAEQLLVHGKKEEGLAVLLPLLEEMGLCYPRTITGALARLAWYSLRLRLRGADYQPRAARELPAELLLRHDVLDAAARGLEFTDLWPALAFHAERSLLALRMGEPSRVLKAYNELIIGYSMHGHYGGTAKRFTALARALAEELGGGRAEAAVEQSVATAHSCASSSWRGGLEHYERADRLLAEHCAGNMRDVRYCRMKAAFCRLRLGELREIASLCDPQLREAVDRGDELSRAAAQVFAKAPLALAADDPATALRVLGATRLPTPGVFRVYHACMESDVHVYSGSAAVACEGWKRWWPEYQRARLDLLPMFRIEATRSHALALAALGDRRALRRAAELAASLRLGENPLSRGSRATILACVEARRGERARAVELLASAALAFDEAEMKLHAAANRRAIGALEGRRELVRAADELMRSEGIARPDRWAFMHAPVHLSRP